MQLSEMLASLSRGAQEMEQRVSKWEGQLNAKSAELEKNARAWLAAAQKRDDELSARASNYLSAASDQVKDQWNRSQAEWDAEVARLRAKAEDASQKAMKMTANERADWYEAYAAHSVAFAERIQEEASNAVAQAARARAEADKLA